MKEVFLLTTDNIAFMTPSTIGGTLVCSDGRKGCYFLHSDGSVHGYTYAPIMVSVEGEYWKLGKFFACTIEYPTFYS
jgi:hypothetical protein